MYFLDFSEVELTKLKLVGLLKETVIDKGTVYILNRSKGVYLPIRDSISNSIILVDIDDYCEYDYKFNLMNARAVGYRDDCVMFIPVDGLSINRYNYCSVPSKFALRGVNVKEPLLEDTVRKLYEGYSDTAYSSYHLDNGVVLYRQKLLNVDAELHGNLHVIAINRCGNACIAFNTIHGRFNNDVILYLFYKMDIVRFEELSIPVFETFSYLVDNDIVLDFLSQMRRYNE